MRETDLIRSNLLFQWKQWGTSSRLNQILQLNSSGGISFVVLPPFLVAHITFFNDAANWRSLGYRAE